LYFDSCFAALRAAGRCFSFAFPAIEDRPTAVRNVGRRPGGNNCDRPIDAINEAWKHDWITVIASASIAAGISAA
jgi:hypothetical protein